MYKTAILPVALLGVAIAFVGGDFWNLGTEADRLKDERGKGEKLDQTLERVHKRFEAIDRIAFNLCEGHIMLDEALDLMGNFAQFDPEWFAQLQISYRQSNGNFLLSDRDVLAIYLNLKIVSMLDRARFFDDESRAAAITDRLAHLEKETQLQKYPAMTP
jgi:hypothetical protein